MALRMITLETEWTCLGKSTKRWASPTTKTKNDEKQPYNKLLNGFKGHFEAEDFKMFNKRGI